jgi:hypothetical protein
MGDMTDACKGLATETICADGSEIVELFDL